MKKKIIIAVIAVACVITAIAVISAVVGEKEKTPEEKLIGTWVQTQEALDYDNENVHSESVTVTEKEQLEFQDTNVCILTSEYQGIVKFKFSIEDGYLLLKADGWATQRYLIDKNKLIDPVTDVVRFKKQ